MSKKHSPAAGGGMLVIPLFDKLNPSEHSHSEGFKILNRCDAYALPTLPNSSIFSLTVALIASKPGARSFLGSKPLP